MSFLQEGVTILHRHAPASTDNPAQEHVSYLDLDAHIILK